MLAEEWLETCVHRPSSREKKLPEESPSLLLPEGGGWEGGEVLLRRDSSLLSEDEGVDPIGDAACSLRGSLTLPPSPSRQGRGDV
jgi:hypothetical protein